MSGIDIEGVLSAEITRYLGAYTLPANYAHPLANERHWDVAERCGPQIAAHVATVLRERVEGAIIAATVGALQYAAGLAGSLENDELAAQLYDAARNTEAQDPADWWCCPVCEEMTCDDGCPLEPIRAAHLSDTERAGGAE